MGGYTRSQPGRGASVWRVGADWAEMRLLEIISEQLAGFGSVQVPTLLAQQLGYYLFEKTISYK